jgi:hypothetical protein
MPQVRLSRDASLVAAASLMLAAAGPTPSQARVSPDKKCSGSRLISEAGVSGNGSGLEISVRPKALFRIAGDSVVDVGWNDLSRCVRIPTISRAQRDSLYKQLACHARYGKLPIATFGGPTWDLEAWRPDIPWDQVYDLTKRCAWVNGPTPATPSAPAAPVAPTPAAPSPPAAPVAPTPAPPSPPAVQSYRYAVYGTCQDAVCGIRKRNGPGYSSFSAVGSLRDGDVVDIVCQTAGELVTPNHGAASAVWDRLTDGSYVTDVYINTPGTGGRFTDAIPRC